MLSLFQESMAWGNESYNTLLLLFLAIQDPRQQPQRPSDLLLLEPVIPHASVGVFGEQLLSWEI